MHRLFIPLLFLLTASLCRGVELRSGDLIFTAERGSGFSDAIATATGGTDSIRFTHVAIIVAESPDSVSVIEASPEGGVREIPLSQFIEGTLAVIKRLDADYPFEAIIATARSHIGEPYDWWFLPDNDKMYCSELVYESYLTESGAHIFEAAPMNFRAADGSMPQFWLELYAELGVPVPEGIPGTNPNDLSKSPLLKIVSVKH